MNRVGADIEAARAALSRAEQALAHALESSPVFRAMGQLNERAARGEQLTGISESALRLRLEQRLDETVPGWRDLPGVTAALSALGRVPAAPPLSVLPPAVEAKDHPSVVPWRPQAPARPSQDAPEPKAEPAADVTHPPAAVLSRIRSLETKSALPAPTSERPANGSRKAVSEIEAAHSPEQSAAAMASDPSRRIAALETIADRLAQGRMEAEKYPWPPLLDADESEPELARFEEAEVEIVTALPSEPPSRTERVADQTALADGPQPAPFSLETFIDDEAEVEIVVAAQATEAAPAPGQPHRGDGA
ncbi:MAG: hypothetical protein JSS20_00485 [Proteobacteria bacterium]|nr:hypothetical protein [Pseudomonadota bacterium]